MKKFKVFLSALVLSMSSFFMFAAPHAFAATRTWDGGGSDDDMMTAANWSADTAPSAGDDLVFPVNVTNRAVDNDFTAATSFNSITFSGTATQNSNYTITGNSMTLVAGITNSMTGSFSVYQAINVALILNGNQTFTAGDGGLDFGGGINLGSHALSFNTGASYSNISSVISGTGSLAKTAGDGALILTGDNTYSGATSVASGYLVGGHQNALGTAAAGTTVTAGASLILYQGSGDLTYSEPLTLNGDGADDYRGALSITNAFGMGGGVAPLPYPTSTFSGAVTLGSNVSLSASSRTGKLTGAITGNFTMSLISSSTGTFQIAASSNGSATPNGTLVQPTKETSYTADSPSTTVSVKTNETAIVTGTYGDVTVNVGGTLKGTGKVGVVALYGTVAPGLSPGCLNTGDFTFLSSSAYAFEVGGITPCSGYDQINVTGTVTLSGALTLSRYNNFKPVAGQKYVLISNDGTDAVTDTFTDLAQGGTFTVDGYTFSISYTGGDGNDVEVTVTAAAPDTGFTLIKNNPFVTIAVTLGAACAILLVARRNQKTAPARARRR